MGWVEAVDVRHWGRADRRGAQRIKCNRRTGLRRADANDE